MPIFLIITSPKQVFRYIFTLPKLIFLRYVPLDMFQLIGKELLHINIEFYFIFISIINFIFSGGGGGAGWQENYILIKTELLVPSQTPHDFRYKRFKTKRFQVFIFDIRNIYFIKIQMTEYP